MALWRFIKVLLATAILSVIVIFFLQNSTTDSHSLATKVSFRLSVPPLFSLESIDFSVGYLLVIAFSMGMIFAALIGAINAFTRSREIKMKNKTIRELEKEIDSLRDTLVREKNVLPEVKLSEELNRVPDQPEIH